MKEKKSILGKPGGLTEPELLLKPDPNDNETQHVDHDVDQPSMQPDA